MKLKIIALGLISCALCAEAQTPRKRVVRPAARPAAPAQRPTPPPASDIVPDFSEQPERESLNVLGDIGYVAPYRKFVAGLSYVMTSVKSDSAILGNNYSKSSYTSSVVGYDVSFGLFQNFSFGVNGSYLSSSSTDTTAGPAAGIQNGQTFHTNASGFDEPTFTGTYRFLNQDESIANLDLILSYSPAMDNRKTATVQSQGNNTRGGDEMGAELDIGKKIGIFEIVGGVQFNQYGKSISESAQTGIQSRDNAYNALTYKAGGRLGLTPQFFLTGTIQYTSISSHSGTEGSGTVTDDPAYTFTAYSVGADYEVKKNFMVLRFLYLNIPTLDSSSVLAGQKTDLKASRSGFGGQILMQF